MKEVTINDKVVKSITLGGALFFESDTDKRYTYYFNGVDAYATFDDIHLGEDGNEFEFHIWQSRDGYSQYKNVINDYIRLYVNANNYNKIIRWYIGNQYQQIGLSTTNAYFILGMRWIGGETYGIWQRVGSVFNKALLASESLPITLNTINPDKEWKGCISSVNINGTEYDLTKLPGIKFHDVVRYELDDNNNMIESTAKTLNTL